MTYEYYALSYVGRRSNNEDAVCARPDLGLFVVADGMGGYAGGEVASRLAVDTIEALVDATAGDRDVTWPYRFDPALGITENEVMVATRLAGERIAERRHGELDHMGSTVVVLRLEAGRAVIGHVGDSRVYRVRGNVVEQLTVDHSLYAQLAAGGAELPPIEEFAYRHVVTRALGTDHGEPELRVEALVAGDAYLLCTDGLSEAVEPAEIAAALALPAEEACRRLVSRAYEAGSRDNISACVVRI